MKRQKKILLAIALILIVLQFIQPARNKNGQVLPTDFARMYAPPAEVQRLLQEACYDCHSNNTRYPWYVHTQPLAWIMAGHIKNGKEKLNFSEFGSYPVRKQESKLKGIVNEIKDDEMPLTSYKWMHASANLSETEKKLLKDWMQKKADSLSAIDK